MEPHQTPDVELPPAIEPQGSPLLPQHLIDLFIRPRHFFTAQLALGKTPYALLVGWCYGATVAIDRIDQNLIREELGNPRPGWDEIAPYLVDSWAGFWAFVLFGGVLSGLLIWWLGGWWFSLRLRWSGAEAPDRRTARLVMIYSAFVNSGPTIAATLISMAFFASYAESYASESLWTLVFVIFPFWSIAASYTGAQAVFGVSGWRPRIWFLILPILFYVSIFGLFAALFAILGEAPPA